MVARRVVSVLSALALVACRGDALDPDRAGVATVVVAPQTATVAVGASIPLTVEVRDAAGNLITGRKVVWATEDPAVATVSDAGVVTGVSVGAVQVVASAEGKSAIAAITVEPTPVASVRLSPPSRDLLVGQTVQLTAEPVDVGGNVLPGRPVTWTTSNADVATVSTSGLVTAIAPGGAIVTANSEGKTAVATITVASVPVAAVAVTPASATVIVGQTAQLSAQARAADGQPLAGRTISWFSSNVGVATVSSAGLVTAVSPGDVTITATSEGKNGTAALTVVPKPVSAVVVSPGQVNVIVGQTAQLTVQVTDEQGNVLSGRPVSYASSSTQIATVSANGVVTGVAPGSATITATSEGKTGTAQVTVQPIPVASVEITPSGPNVVVGQTIQLSATARSASGQVLPGRTTIWTSGAPGIASVSGTGVVSGITPGTAIIFANVEGVSASVAVAVRQVTVATVDVTPATASIAAGQTVQLSATVKDASGTVLTGRLVGWSSSDETVAAVSSTGLVSGLKAGTVTITAVSEGKSGTATVTVTPGGPTPVATVTVSPSTLSLQVGQTGTLTATMRDASNNVLTGRAVTWTTSNANVATVSVTGTVTAVGAGTATITATSEGKSGTASVTVTALPPAPVATVTLSPSPVNVTVGGTQQVTATLRDASGNVLTGRTITWSSANTGLATVSPSGLVTGVAIGGTTVTATSEGQSGTVSVNVGAAPIGSVAVAPSSGTVNVAWTTTLTATVRDANGNVVSGAPVTWTTSNPAVAIVSQTGVVTGVAPGSATITASSGGQSGTASITVQLAPVFRVEVTPSSFELEEGQTRQLTATLFDERNNVLTGRPITWSSSRNNVAMVSSTGLVTARNDGTAEIRATSEGKTGTAMVRVIDD